jgi:hypothetical protein
VKLVSEVVSFTFHYIIADCSCFPLNHGMHIIVTSGQAAAVPIVSFGVMAVVQLFI